MITIRSTRTRVQEIRGGDASGPRNRSNPDDQHSIIKDIVNHQVYAAVTLMEDEKLTALGLSDQRLFEATQSQSPYSVNQTPTHICLIIDFCPGGELFALVDKHRPMSSPSVLVLPSFSFLLVTFSV
ncbi:hypothetical protein QYF36_012186 [Acer negundo]|nr:hypothetical protein QYF36_012186 [Acer negundo]